jgi:hypothetical protein
VLVKPNPNGVSWLYRHPETGEWALDEERASVVQWVFQRAWAGRTAAEIADELNTSHEIRLPRKWIRYPKWPADLPRTAENRGKLDRLAKRLGPHEYETKRIPRTPPISDRARKGGTAKDVWITKDVHELLTNRRVLRSYGPVGPIVDKQTFDDVQRIRKHAGGGNANPTNMLRGLVYCRDCGKALRLRGTFTNKITKPHFECFSGCLSKHSYFALEGLILEAVFGHSHFLPQPESNKPNALRQQRQRFAAMLRMHVDRIDVSNGALRVLMPNGKVRQLLHGKPQAKGKAAQERRP